MIYPANTKSSVFYHILNNHILIVQLVKFSIDLSFFDIGTMHKSEGYPIEFVDDLIEDLNVDLIVRYWLQKQVVDKAFHEKIIE